MLLQKDLRVSLYTMKNILKPKIKSSEGKINTNFHNDKMSKEGSHCICLSVLLFDSVSKMNKSYYPQVFSEECKYIVKEKGATRHITEELEISPDSDEPGEEWIKMGYFLTLIMVEVFRGLFLGGGYNDPSLSKIC